jgi:hypothetical protein
MKFRSTVEIAPSCKSRTMTGRTSKRARRIPLRVPLMAMLLVAVAMAVLPVVACTSLLVTRGASADGSVMITYHCDDAGGFAALAIVPAMDHRPGEMIEIGPRDPVTKAPRGCGASCGGRRPPKTFLPTTTAPSPAPNLTPSA